MQHKTNIYNEYITTNWWWVGDGGGSGEEGWRLRKSGGVEEGGV